MSTDRGWEWVTPPMSLRSLEKEENKMKLERRPVEFEHDGYRWVCTGGHNYSCDRDERTITYTRKEKLYVPPTAKQIMDHLVKGGWVKVTYEYLSEGAIYIRLRADGKDTEYFDTDERHKDWQGHNIAALFVGNNGKKELIACGLPV